MKIDIVVPQAGESVTEAMIGSWAKPNGSFVQKDEVILELETDKTNLEIVAEQDGILEITAQEGQVVQVGDVIGRIDPSAKPDASKPKNEKSRAPAPEPATPDEEKSGSTPSRLSPSMRRLATEKGVDTHRIEGSGRRGRVRKEDVLAATESPHPQAPPPARKQESKTGPHASPSATEDRARRVPMTMLRRRIAQRLVEAQKQAAILTTFNEIDMSQVMSLRKQHQDAFLETHGVKLGFMSFFVKAAIHALQSIPEINAQIDGNDILYFDRYDIGVAVGTDKGLVVPIIRDADRMSFAEIETSIADLASRASQGKLDVSELSGGTFTISNGGIYGNLLSTPILNPPQSGILGLHKIQKRPVVVDDQIVARPMMYVAMSYDHRIVDGREAVTFLRMIKNRMEDPTRMLFDI